MKIISCAMFLFAFRCHSPTCAKLHSIAPTYTHTHTHTHTPRIHSTYTQESGEIKLLEEQLAKLRTSMSTQADSIHEMQTKSNEEIAQMQKKNQKLREDLAEAKAAAEAATAAAAAASKASKAPAPPPPKAPPPKVDSGKADELRKQLDGVTSERDSLNEQVAKLKTMLTSSAEDKANAAKAAADVAKAMQEALQSTESAFKAKRHANCKAAYIKVLTESYKTLKDAAPDLAASLKSDQRDASRGRNLPRASMMLRSVLQEFVDDHGVGLDGGGNAAELDALKQKLELKDQETAELEKQLKATKKLVESAGKAKSKQLEKEKKAEQKKVKEMKVKVKQLQSALEKANRESGQAAADKATAAAEKVAKKKLDAQEKKNAKQLEALTADNEAKVKKIQAQSKKITKDLEAANAQLAEVTAEMKKFKKLASGSKEMEKEIAVLQEKVTELKTCKKQAKDAVAKAEELHKLYKKEQILRKRYWNMMEDMKGKIRVYARCRPFAKYEIERGCKKVVSFGDDVTIVLKTEKFGDKEFVYDQCFSPTSTNEQVFEDTRRLVHSAIDGFNVCVFAYGQTGSGKTYTVVGNDASPGLIPRGIREIFDIIKENVNCEAKCTSYMVELYNDVLVDLFYLARNSHNAKKKKSPPKLDIKKDSKGMVHIQNAVVRPAIGMGMG